MYDLFTGRVCVIVQDQGLSSDDDEVLKEMMDVEFPAFNSGNDDDDKTGKSDAFTSAVTVDIKTQGWDDDAIVRCLDLAIDYHNNQEHESSNPMNFEFSPVPNMKRNAAGHQQTNIKEDEGDKHSENHEIGLNIQKNEINMKTKNNKIKEFIIVSKPSTCYVT